MNTQSSSGKKRKRNVSEAPTAGVGAGAVGVATTGGRSEAPFFVDAESVEGRAVVLSAYVDSPLEGSGFKPSELDQRVPRRVAICDATISKNASSHSSKANGLGLSTAITPSKRPSSTRGIAIWLTASNRPCNGTSDC